VTTVLENVPEEESFSLVVGRSAKHTGKALKWVLSKSHVSMSEDKAWKEKLQGLVLQLVPTGCSRA